MSFDVYDKNKLIGMVQIDGYEKVTYCEDCTYYDDCNIKGYCWFHESMVNLSDYCSKAKAIRKDDEE